MSIPKACAEAAAAPGDFELQSAHGEARARRVILALADDPPADALEKAFEQAQREASELPDRTSPKAPPDMMLVSVEELDAIVLGAIRIFLKHVAGETP